MPLIVTTVVLAIMLHATTSVANAALATMIARTTVALAIMSIVTTIAKMKIKKDLLNLRLQQLQIFLISLNWINFDPSILKAGLRSCFFL